MSPSKRWFPTAVLIGGLAFALSAQAQKWPDKPIRIVATAVPGSPSDVSIRMAASKMQATLGQPLVIDNRTGAGGNIGAAEAARASPDGYTWLWTPDAVVTVNPHIYTKLSFNPQSLVPVAIGSSSSQTLVCNPATGVKTLAELVKKAQAEKLNYASGGAGSPGHLSMELLLAASKLKMQHIPYKGPGPAAQDIVGGEVACGFLAGPTVLPHIRSGRLVALAVSGARRSPVLPDVPTVAEAGYPGYEATFLSVLLAPKGTPQPIVEAMQKALVDALKSPDIVEALKATDQDMIGSSTAQAIAQIEATSAKWGAVSKRIGLTLD